MYLYLNFILEVPREGTIYYDDPDPREDIKSIIDSVVITESHFAQEWAINGIAPI